MSDDAAIADVLDGFVPIGDEHPKARETFESVQEFIAARVPERRVTRSHGLDDLRAEVAELRAIVNELVANRRDSHV